MTGAGDDAAPIWTVAKRDGEVRATPAEYKGRAFLDIRLWCNGGDTPTTKGVTVPLDAIASMGRALDRLRGANRAHGA